MLKTILAAFALALAIGVVGGATPSKAADVSKDCCVTCKCCGPDCTKDTCCCGGVCCD